MSYATQSAQRLAVVSITLILSITSAARQISPSFEVASVKTNKSADLSSSQIRLDPGGRFTATNVPLGSLIRNAYQLNRFQIVGAPDWVENERFDVVAMANAQPNPETVLLMLRSLLAERFRLVSVRETRDIPVYALVMAEAGGKLGSELRPSLDIDCLALRRAKEPMPATPSPTVENPKPLAPCSFRSGGGRIQGGAIRMDRFAESLSSWAGRLVVDQTGLTGSFDVDLQFTVDPSPSSSGASLVTALREQLGLKLQSVTAPVEVLTIKSVERPTPD